MADTPMHEIEQCPACGQTRCTPNPDELRALRESHDALRDSLQEFAEGPWHNSKCAGWSEDEGETEYDMRTVMRPELCDCAISRARAALAKAEALQKGESISEKGDYK